jgi:RNA polymerase sigma-70 factor (ECF subfamily)
MGKIPETRPSLLVRLRDTRDGQAWAQFVDLYAPLVYGFARKQGLQDADASDLTQEVLRAVAGAAGRLEYDPARGPFRAWLFTVVRNKLRNFLKVQGRHERAGGGSDARVLLEEQPDPALGREAQWDREYERRLFDWAAGQVRGAFEEATWRAFWQTAVEAHSPAEVARELGMSVGAVYIAKSRVLARLREEIRQLQADGE